MMILERKGHLTIISLRLNTARSKIQAASVSNGYKPDSLAWLSSIALTIVALIFKKLYVPSLLP